MTPDVQLAQDFPYTRPDVPEDAFTGETIEDVIRRLPREARKAWEAAAKETRDNPCKILEDADKIYQGLKNGTVTYKKTDFKTGFVEFNGTDIKMHGAHLSAIVQRYGDNSTTYAPFERTLPPEASRALADYHALMMGKKSTFASNLIEKLIPDEPNIKTCLTM